MEHHSIKTAFQSIEETCGTKRHCPKYLLLINYSTSIRYQSFDTLCIYIIDERDARRTKGTPGLAVHASSIHTKRGQSRFQLVSLLRVDYTGVKISGLKK